MNIRHVDYEEYCDIVTRSNLLRTTDWPSGTTVHVAEYEGKDVFIVGECMTGTAMIIPGQLAGRDGGESVHDQIRRLDAGE